MKMKFIQRYSEDYPKGSEVTVDKIDYDPEFNGRYKVRITSMGKKPVYLAIAWFISKANDLPPLWLVKDK